MNDAWVNRWNDRYSTDEFAYGEQPNNYLKEQLMQLETGTILFRAEGEGRNAVFAANLVGRFQPLTLVSKEKTKHFNSQKTITLASITSWVNFRSWTINRNISMLLP